MLLLHNGAADFHRLCQFVANLKRFCQYVNPEHLFKRFEAAL